MLDLAVIDDGDGLETAMRMLADAAPLLRWFEIVRPGIVEQQEWAYVRAQRVVREERPDREAVAHPMLPVVAVTARSEEHTSELQSLMRISYAVFCLKKKKKYTLTQPQTHT